MILLITIALLQVTWALQDDCTCNIVDYGAKADNTTLATTAIEAAITACRSQCSQGATVIVPTGAFLIGSILLQSNITLELQTGSLLTGISSQAAYPLVPFEPPMGDTLSYRALIACYNCSNIAIVGNGTIDGNGYQWWANYTQGVLKNQRPKLVELVHSNNILLRGFTAQNSAFWTIHPVFSRDIHVAELTILAPRLIGNTDGIDLDSCVNVTMVDSLVDVGDDGICIKAGIDQTKTRVATDGVLVERCRIWSRNFAIGSDVSGWVRNVVVRNSIISSPQGSAPWAIKIKGHQNTGGGVENVSFVNLTVGPIGPTPQQPHSSVFLDVYMNYGSSASPCANPHSTAPDTHVCVDGAWRYRPASLAGSPPIFRNIIFDNVTVVSANDAGSIEGLPNSNVTGLSFHNVVIQTYEKSWSCQYVNNTYTDHVSPSWGCN